MDPRRSDSIQRSRWSQYDGLRFAYDARSRNIVKHWENIASLAESEMSESPFVYRATEENFQALVVENSFKGPVLVDFWAARAGPSRRQAELLTRPRSHSSPRSIGRIRAIATGSLDAV